MIDHTGKCMSLREKTKKEMESREQWIQHRCRSPQDNGKKGSKVSTMQEVQRKSLSEGFGVFIQDKNQYKLMCLNVFKRSVITWEEFGDKISNMHLKN